MSKESVLNLRECAVCLAKGKLISLAKRVKIVFLLLSISRTQINLELILYSHNASKELVLNLSEFRICTIIPCTHVPRGELIYNNMITHTLRHQWEKDTSYASLSSPPLGSLGAQVHGGAVFHEVIAYVRQIFNLKMIKKLNQTFYLLISTKNYKV